MINIELHPDEAVRITFAESDGDLVVDFGSDAIRVQTDWPDEKGRKGVIYEERFRKADADMAEERPEAEFVQRHDTKLIEVLQGEMDIDVADLDPAKLFWPTVEDEGNDKSYIRFNSDGGVYDEILGNRFEQAMNRNKQLHIRNTERAFWVSNADFPNLLTDTDPALGLDADAIEPLGPMEARMV